MYIMKNYFSKYCDNISLKVTKAICKNIILHNENSKNLALSFNIAGNDNSAKKIEIATHYTAFNTPNDQTALKTFFTDSLGNLLLTDSEQSSLSSQTDADIIRRYSSTDFMEPLYQMHIPDTTISKAVSMHTAGHMQEESSETVFQMISKMQKIRFRLLR